MRKKSISENVLGRRVAEIGQIKIGGQSQRTKKGKGKPPPEKFDHFVVVTREREDGTGNFIKNAEIHAIVGEKPRELDIWLTKPTPAENFYSQMQVWKGEDLVRECDGEEFMDYSTGEEGPCPRAGDGCECGPYGRLKVLLHAAPSFGGEFGFRTHSWETIRNIQSALEFFYQSFGTLEGLPLKLVLYPATDRTAEGKRYKNWKVGLVMGLPFTEAAQLAVKHHRAARLAREEAKGLLSPAEVLPEIGTPIDEPEEVSGPGSEYFEDESQEEEPEQAGDDQAEALRKRYHVRLTELIADSREREDVRHAYHRVHPELPDSEKDFTAAHYTRVLSELERHGMKLLEQAVTSLARTDPATEEEIEELKAAIDASGCDADLASNAWRVIDAGVGTWVGRETQRLKLNAAQASQASGEDEKEAQPVGAKDGELPF